MEPNKIDWRDIARKASHLLIPAPVLLILLCPAWETIAASSFSHSLASLSQVSLNIYLMRTDRSTYVCISMLFFCNRWSQPFITSTIIVMSLLRQATEIWKIKMLWHPRGYSWNTPPRVGLFQRVVSGWKATQKRCGSTRPGQNVSLIGINTMTLSGRRCETFKTARKVYHNSSDHNRSIFHWGVVGDLRVHNIYISRVLVPVPDLQRESSGYSLPSAHYMCKWTCSITD